jgi:hypothetical protein
MAFPQPPRDPLRVPVTALRWTRYALALDDYTIALPQPAAPAARIALESPMIAGW